MDIDRDLLHRYLLGDSSEEENAQIVRWVDEDSKHYDELKALGIIYDAKIWFQDKNVHTEKTAPIFSTNRFKHIVIEICKIAAVFVIGFLLNNIVQQFTPTAKSKMLSFYAPVGQRAELTLDDGTHVWLNAKTKFSFPTNFEVSNRNVSLDGEAYFDVTHDSKRPFIVKAGKYSIQVYGTEFNVNAYSGKSIFETALLKGSVRVGETNKQANSLMLQPGYKVAVKNDRFVKSPITQYSYFKWKEGLICFDDNTIGEMLNKLELYFDVHFIIKNAHIINQRYTGKFRGNDGVEQVLKTLQLRSKFKYEFDDDRDVVTIN